MNQTRDWRAKPAGPTATSNSRPARLAFLTFLGLGLAGVFVWAIWHYIFPKPPLIFAYLPVSAYQTLAADPLGFQAEDAAAFEQAVGRAKHGRFIQFTAHSEVQDLQTLLEAQLEAAVADSQSPLVLVVSAHGLTVAGKPCLLASNYDPLAAPGSASGTLLSRFCSSNSPVPRPPSNC